MTTLRPFNPTDILKFNAVNVDPWTATYHNGYYAMYTAKWPDWCITAETPQGDISAYMISKHEPPPPDTQHHGHLTALSISPQLRGTGLARVFMDILESLSGSHVVPRSKKGTPQSIDEKGDSDGQGSLEGVGSKGEGGDASNGTKKPEEKYEPYKITEEIPITEGDRVNVDAVNAYFVDLFVRCNNVRAVEMYEKLGYSVYRRVVDYYHGMEGIGSTRDELDGFDMRRSMPKDSGGKYVRSNGKDILVSPDQVWA